MTTRGRRRARRLKQTRYTPPRRSSAAPVDPSDISAIAAAAGSMPHRLAVPAGEASTRRSMSPTPPPRLRSATKRADQQTASVLASGALGRIRGQRSASGARVVPLAHEQARAVAREPSCQTRQIGRSCSAISGTLTLEQLGRHVKPPLLDVEVR